MKNFFYTSDTVPEGLGIEHYGIEHLCWLLAAVAFIAGISLLYRKADAKLRRKIQVVMASLIVLEEVTRDIFLIVTNQFSVCHLPLHLCSVNIILIAVHAIKRTKTVDNFLYLSSGLTLCDPMDCTLPGSSVLGILQARILEWVAMSFSRGSSRPRDRTQV